MKIRNGFISNSSSSSFLIGTSDTSTLFGNKSSNDVIDYSVEDPTYYSLEDDYKSLTVGGAVELLNRNGFPKAIDNLWEKINTTVNHNHNVPGGTIYLRSLLFNLAVKDNSWYWHPERLTVDFYYIPKNLRRHFLDILELAKRYRRFGNRNDWTRTTNRNGRTRLANKRRKNYWNYDKDYNDVRGFYDIANKLRNKIDSMIDDAVPEVVKFVLKRLDEKYGIKNLHIVEAGNEFDYDPDGHGGEVESAIYRCKNYIVSLSCH